MSLHVVHPDQLYHVDKELEDHCEGDVNVGLQYMMQGEWLIEYHHSIRWGDLRDYITHLLMYADTSIFITVALGKFIISDIHA